MTESESLDAQMIPQMKPRRSDSIPVVPSGFGMSRRSAGFLYLRGASNMGHLDNHAGQRAIRDYGFHRAIREKHEHNRVPHMPVVGTCLTCGGPIHKLEVVSTCWHCKTWGFDGPIKESR